MSVTTQARTTTRARAAWFVWLVLLLPTLGLAGAFIQAASVRIAHTDDERTGVTVLRTIDEVIAAADAYRFAGASGWPNPRLAQRVDATLGTFQRLDDTLPGRLALGAGFTAIVDDWKRLRREQSPPEARLSGWIERLVGAVSDISDRSRITYDPGNDTINLGDALAIQYTRAAEHFARLADVITRTSSSPAVPLALRFRIARLQSEALDAERLGNSDLSEAMHVDPALKQSLARESSAIHGASMAYANAVDGAFVTRVAPRRVSLIAAGRRVVQRQQAMKTRLSELLDRALATRNARERNVRAAAFAATTLFGTISFAIVAALIRSLALAGLLDRIKAEQAREREIGAVQRELWTAEEKFRVTFEQTPVGILVVDADLETLQANPALCALVPDVSAILVAETELFERALASGENQRFERRYRQCDDQFVWAEVVLRGVSTDADGPRYVLGTFRDVTESKALASRLVYDATHDALTGLPNRTYFENALCDALERSAACTGDRSALLFLDLDDFKLVNDSVGHHAGDAVLVATGDRLRKALPDDAIICRLAGDEFAVILRYDTDADWERSAEHLVAVLGEPLAYDGSSLVVRASIGSVALGPERMRAEDALRAADTAMYQAKALGGGRHVVFDARLYAHINRRKQLTNDLRLTIEAAAIEVAYQPIVDLRSGRVLGFEALARWTHPSEGSIAPAEFVPLAEESGTIERLGTLVLHAACRQLAMWRAEVPGAREWLVSVNVAARQILSGSIVEDLRSALSAHGIPGERVSLEITESVLLDHVAQANETLAALRNLGAKICIDDFGTGYSSLQYLQRFPVDGIKIDRSFVSGGPDGLASEPIVQMLVMLSRVLKLDVVVEGIETQTQLQRLLSLGCTSGQGFLFSPPVSAHGAARYATSLVRLPEAS